jgi:hypothetical protein
VKLSDATFDSKNAYEYVSVNYRTENGRRCFDKVWNPTTIVEGSVMSKMDRLDLDQNYSEKSK